MDRIRRLTSGEPLVVQRGLEVVAGLPFGLMKLVEDFAPTGHGEEVVLPGGDECGEVSQVQVRVGEEVVDVPTGSDGLCVVLDRPRQPGQDRGDRGDVCFAGGVDAVVDEPAE